MFRYKMIPWTNKPTRVTRKTANAIDHIITNTVIGQNGFKSVIIKTDLSDRFPALFPLKIKETTQKPKVNCIYKRSRCEKCIEKI